MSPRYHWLLLYVAVNIIAACIMMNTGELLGDLSGNSLHSLNILLMATILVVLSYVIVLGPLFTFMNRLKIKKLHYGPGEDAAGERIGKLLVVMGTLFFIYNIYTGGNVAGKASITTTNPLRVVWVLFPVDAMFVLYYGFYRENKYFYPNLVIWIISNLQRGWAGIFLLIIFFEWCRAYRKNNITVLRTSMMLVIITILFPFLTAFKFLLRSSGRGEISFTSASELLVDTFSRMDISKAISGSLEAILYRIQVTSNLVEIIRLQPLLQREFLDGRFAPFWAEGMPGYYWGKFFGKQMISITQQFPQYVGYFGSSDVDLTSFNISLPAWCFIAPHLTLFYLFYVIILCFLSIWLVSKIGISESSKDMVWLIWLLFILPPWLAVVVDYLYALVVFMFVKILVSRKMSFV